MLFKTIAPLATLLSAVAAHGVVGQIDVDGQTYQGPLAGQSKDSPIWTVASSSPVTDLNSNDLFCGLSATPNGQSPSIGAGATLTYTWISGYGGYTPSWPHNTGPIQTYMGKCNGDCNSANSGDVKFFKISELGLEDGQWVQAKLKQGQTVSAQIPSDLQPGNYLVRHEIVGLHSSPAEIYPSCSSWTITGSGTNDYSSAATASFPGTYSSSDAGLSDSGGNVYSIQSNDNYQFPGPSPVSQGSNSGGNSSNNVAAAQSSQGSSSSSSGASSSSTQQSSSSTQQSQPTQSSSGGDSGGDCNSQYQQCVQSWQPGGEFDCQNSFVQCQQQSAKRSTTLEGATRRSTPSKRSQQRHARMMRRRIRF